MSALPSGPRDYARDSFTLPPVNKNDPYRFPDVSFNSDNTFSYQVDLSDIIDETLRGMLALHEQQRLRIVVEYLRGIGYTVIEPVDAV